jgi:hypothetical protein
MRGRRLTLAAVALFVVAGCAVDQKKEVATYRKVVDIPTTAPAADFSSGQPLTLRRVEGSGYGCVGITGQLEGNRHNKSL